MIVGIACTGIYIKRVGGWIPRTIGAASMAANSPLPACCQEAQVAILQHGNSRHERRYHSHKNMPCRWPSPICPALKEAGR